MAQNNENMKTVVVVLLSAEECRTSTGAQPVTVRRSRAARKAASGAPPTHPLVRWCLGPWARRRGTPAAVRPFFVHRGQRRPASRYAARSTPATARRQAGAASPRDPGVAARRGLGSRARSAVSRVSLSAELGRVWPRVGGGLFSIFE